MSYVTKVHSESNGDALHVESGGEIDIQSGGTLEIAGVDQTAALGAAVAGVAAGYKVARGETALDGGNPTAVATGLTTIIAFVATLKGSSAPGLGTSTLTATVSDGAASVYARTPTRAGDTTLIASTGTESFYWIAIGV